MNSSKLAFGLRLRAHRERRGISHEALAESLKIRRSLLSDLERGDVSHWPSGIYRRALFREYVKAVGLPAAESLEEFSELFSETLESQRFISVDSPLGRRSGLPPRLTLAEPSTATPRVVYRRLASAIADLALVLGVGYVVTLLIGSAYWTATGIVALVWYPATAALGHHPLRQAVRNARVRRTSPARESVPHVAGSCLPATDGPVIGPAHDQ